MSDPRAARTRVNGLCLFNLVKELIYVTQKYEHRHDKLETREHDVRTNTVDEHYLPGRSDQLKGIKIQSDIQLP